MNFDKYKNEKPDPAARERICIAAKDSDAEYIEKLAALPDRKQSRAPVWRAVGTVAAVFAAVIAVTAWMLIGLGLRNGSTVPGGAAKTYAVRLLGGQVLEEDRAQMQEFFNDYTAEKPCTLELTYLFEAPAGSEDDLPVLTVTLTCDEYGRAHYKNTVPENSYVETAYAEKVFHHLKFVLGENAGIYLYYMEYACAYNEDPNEPAEVKELGYELLDKDDDRAQPYFFCETVDVDLGFIENSRDNCERVFDHSKAEPVVIENGLVTAGEESLQEFFSSYGKRQYAYVEIRDGQETKKLLYIDDNCNLRKKNGGFADGVELIGTLSFNPYYISNGPDADHSDPMKELYAIANYKSGDFPIDYDEDIKILGSEIERLRLDRGFSCVYISHPDKDTVFKMLPYEYKNELAQFGKAFENAKLSFGKPYSRELKDVLFDVSMQGYGFWCINDGSGERFLVQNQFYGCCETVLPKELENALRALAELLDEEAEPEYDGVYRVKSDGEGKVTPRAAVRAFAKAYAAGSACTLEYEKGGKTSTYIFGEDGVFSNKASGEGVFRSTTLVLDRTENRCFMSVSEPYGFSPTADPVPFFDIELGAADDIRCEGERVYDTASVKQPVIENGRLVSGADTVLSFFRRQARGQYAELDIGGNRNVTMGGFAYKLKESGYEYTKFSLTCSGGTAALAREMPRTVDFAEPEYETLFTVSVGELLSSGLIFCPGESGYSIYDGVNDEPQDRMTNNEMTELERAFDGMKPVLLDKQPQTDDKVEYWVTTGNVSFALLKGEIGLVWIKFYADNTVVFARCENTLWDYLTTYTGGEYYDVEKLIAAARRYRYDYLPEIHEGREYDVRYYYDYCIYAYAVSGFPEHVRGKEFKGILSRYFAECPPDLLKLSDDYYVPMEIGEYNDTFMYPVSFRAVSGGYSVCFNCYYPGYEGVTEKAVREAFERGDAEETVACTRRVTVKYSSPDKTTPDKIISCVREQKWDDGQWHRDDDGVENDMTKVLRYGELARASLENWLNGREDVAAYKTSRAYAAANNGFVRGTVRLAVKPAKGAKDEWIARGFSEYGEWLTGSIGGVFVRGKNGDLSYLDGCGDAKTLEEALEIAGKRAFEKHLEEAGGLKEYRVNKVTVGKSERNDYSFELYAEYDVLPKSSARNEWFAGNGKEGADGWIVNKITYANARVRDGELLLSDYGTGK